MIKLKVFETMARRGFKTRLALSEAAGIHKANLGKIVNGDVLAFRLDTLNKLCKVLECQPGDLLEYVPETVTPEPVSDAEFKEIVKGKEKKGSRAVKPRK